jgi:ribosomal protein S18 acetylase RimI-like enzyme
VDDDPFDLVGWRVRRLGEADIPTLDRLHARCADFVRLVEGRDPTSDDSRAMLHNRPERVAEKDKFVFGLFENDELNGVIELLRDYPSAGTWYLGTLLLAPECRRMGVGASSYEALAVWIAQSGGNAVRLIVQRDNPAALRFWSRYGFRVVRTLEQHTSQRTHTVDELEHILVPTPGH